MAVKTKKQQEEQAPAADEKREETLTQELQEVEGDASSNQEPVSENQEPVSEQVDEPEADSSKLLIAQSYILHLSHQYKPGDILPANYPDMVDAWIDAGTAAWVDAESIHTDEKAVPVSAISCVAGMAVSSESEDGIDLVGRVPLTEARKK